MKSCWAQYLLWLVIVLLGTGSVLSACGQKGALYHPESSTNTNESTANNEPSVIKEPSS